jgi:hypothetical protein
MVAHPIPETMVAAIRWRQESSELRRILALCARCKGAGTVWWCGKPGEGGRKGPCPYCQREGVKRFCKELARETFG